MVQTSTVAAERSGHQAGSGFVQSVEAELSSADANVGEDTAVARARKNIEWREEEDGMGKRETGPVGIGAARWLQTSQCRFCRFRFRCCSVIYY